jgi:phosphoserine phosphatase
MQGELDFAAALRERVGLLAGLDASVIERCLAERIRPNPGAETLVRTTRLHGGETILVSGGFTAFVAPIAEAVGFAHCVANALEVRDGKLTGEVEGRIVDSAVKRETLVEARERLGLEPEMTVAIGDGANDIAMVEEAGLGIAYRGKPALAAIADARLDHHGLDALLWAADIPRRHWVTEG